MLTKGSYSRVMTHSRMPVVEGSSGPYVAGLFSPIQSGCWPE